MTWDKRKDVVEKVAQNICAEFGIRFSDLMPTLIGSLNAHALLSEGGELSGTAATARAEAAERECEGVATVLGTLAPGATASVMAVAARGVIEAFREQRETLREELERVKAENARMREQVERLTLALTIATQERNVREQKIDEILETSYATMRTPEEFADLARRLIGATARARESAAQEKP